MLPVRSQSAWRSCKETVDTSEAVVVSELIGTPSNSPPTEFSSMRAMTAATSQLDPSLTFPVETIVTGFDPTSPVNSKNPCPMDHAENAEWTTQQREAASGGVIIQDVTQLRELVSVK